MLKLADPDIWWDTVERHLGDSRLPIALLTLAITGALGIAAASEIGIRYFNTDWNFAFGYSVQRDRGWGPFFALWGGTVIALITQGLVGAALMRIYSKPRLWMRAVSVAIIGSIPMYVAALALVLLPGVLLFAFAFLLSCGWWTGGGRRLLGLGYGEAPEHVVVSLTISAGLMLLLSAGLTP